MKFAGWIKGFKVDFSLLNLASRTDLVWRIQSIWQGAQLVTALEGAQKVLHRRSSVSLERAGRSVSTRIRVTEDGVCSR